MTSFVAVVVAFASVAFASAAFETCIVDVALESSQRDAADKAFAVAFDRACIAEDSFASSAVVASFAAAAVASSSFFAVDIAVAADFEHSE